MLVPPLQNRTDSELQKFKVPLNINIVYSQPTQTLVEHATTFVSSHQPSPITKTNNFN